MAIDFKHDRQFGSDINFQIKKKLERRQKTKQMPGPGESMQEAHQSGMWRHGGKEGSDSQMSTRSPWIRMWCAVQTYILEDDDEATRKARSETEPLIKAGETVKKKKPKDIRIYQIGNNVFRDYSKNNTWFDSQVEKIVDLADGDDSARISTIGGGQLTENQFMKPSAGIKSLTSTYLGDTGLSRETVVNFTVNNIYDYDNIILPYFLRPGSKVFIDYGWNTSNVYDQRDYIVRKAGGGIKADEDLETAIFKNESGGILHDAEGDMDTVVGLVTNFDAKANKTGGFDCTVTIISTNYALIDHNQTNGADIADIISTKVTQRLWDFVSKKLNLEELENEDLFNDDEFKSLLAYSIGYGTKGSWVDFKAPDEEDWFNMAEGDNNVLYAIPDEAYQSGIHYQLLEDVHYANVELKTTQRQDCGTSRKKIEAEFQRCIHNVPQNWKDNGWLTYMPQQDQYKLCKKMQEDMMDEFLKCQKSGKTSAELIVKDRNKKETNLPPVDENLFISLGTLEQILNDHLGFTAESADDTSIKFDLTSAYVNYNYWQSLKQRVLRQKEIIPFILPTFNWTGDTDALLYNKVKAADIFVSLKYVTQAFRNRSEVKLALQDLLDEFSAFSAGTNDFKLTAGGLENKIMLMDRNVTIQKGETLDERDAFKDLDFDDYFVFNVYGPDSIVTQFDLSMNLQNDNLKNAMAIKSMDYGKRLFVLNDKIRQDLALKELTRGIDESDNSDYYYEHLPNYTADNANETIIGSLKQQSVNESYGQYTTIPAKEYNELYMSHILAQIYQNGKQGNAYWKNFYDYPELQHLMNHKIGDNDTGRKICSQYYNDFDAEYCWHEVIIPPNEAWNIASLPKDVDRKIPMPGTVIIIESPNASYAQSRGGKIKPGNSSLNSNIVNKKTPSASNKSNQMIVGEDEFPPVLYADSIAEYFDYKVRIEDAEYEYNLEPIDIPYTLNLTIHGIAGILPTNAINVDYLPKNYKDRVYFVITKVKQTINAGKWETELECAMRYRSNQEWKHIDWYRPKIQMNKSVLESLGFKKQDIENIYALPLEWWTVYPGFSGNVQAEGFWDKRKVCTGPQDTSCGYKKHPSSPPGEALMVAGNCTFDTHNAVWYCTWREGWDAEPAPPSGQTGNTAVEGGGEEELPPT